MLKEVLGHTKMLNFTGTGLLTGCDDWFGALFGTLVTAYGQVLNPEFVLPIIGHFVGYEFFSDLLQL